MQEEITEEREHSESIEKYDDQMDTIIKHHVYGAMAAALIPVPFLDFVGVSGVQMNMLRKLAEAYDVPFSKDMVKNLIGALIGSALPISVGSSLGWSLAKTVPVFGYALGAASLSVVSGACTYAVGMVFNRHFSEGGTFLTFDPEEARAFYAEMFEQGEKVAGELKAQKEKEDKA